MRVKEGSEKAGLKFNIHKNEVHGIQSHHFMANKGETKETLTDFIFLGFKITAGGDRRHEIKKCLLLGRKAMTNLDITLPTKVLYTLPTKVKAMVFPIVIYGCESWTIKKAGH